MDLKIETFRQEIERAMKSYDRHIVCLFKTPDECLEAIERLIIKAIKAYENRAEGMRHGIALDKEITIMLSQQMEQDPFAPSILTSTVRITARTVGVILSIQIRKQKLIHLTKFIVT